VVFTLDRDAGTVAQVRIRPADGRPDVLGADDRAWVVIPPAKRLSVALVSEDDFFTGLALQHLPNAEFRRLTPGQYSSDLSAGTLESFDVVVLDGWLPAGPLGPGAFLVLGGVPAGLGLTVGAGESADEIIDWDEQHPVLRDVELGGRVSIARAPRVSIDEGASAEAIVQAGVGPVVFDAATASTRALVVAFDPDASSWPFDISYVVFLAAAVETLGGLDPVADEEQTRPGGTLSARLPLGARSVRLRVPEGSEVSLTPSADGRVAFGPVPRAGVYGIEWSGPAGAGDTAQDGRVTRPLAVNLLDEAETDVRALDSVVFASGEVKALEAGQSLTPRRLWKWLLLAVLLVMLVEWWVYHRRVYL
jgi:hypothetical protein